MHATDVTPPASAAAVPVADRLVLLAARFAQVDVHVDEPGTDDLARGVEGAVGLQCGCGPTPRMCSPRIHRSVT